MAAQGLTAPYALNNSIAARQEKLKARIDPETGYIPWRWIAVLQGKSTTCPTIDKWDLQPPLLSKKTRRYRYPGLTREDWIVIAKRKLNQLCVYTTKVRPVPKLVVPSGIVAADPDRIVSAYGSDNPAVIQNGSLNIQRILANEFLRRVGSATLPVIGSPKVQLTFLDSEPDGGLSSDPHVGLPQHGYALGHLAQEIVCSHSCAATISNVRVLSYNDPSQGPLPPNQPGSVGALSELGPQILKAISDWKQAGSPGHLILNLSIGWDGDKDLKAGSFSELDSSVQSIYSALQVAARNNVLVIAASGNRRGGSLHDSDWPTLPAAWELKAPPSVYADSFKLTSRGGNKLVYQEKVSKQGRQPVILFPRLAYAVGGVDWQGLPLPNSRTKGLPRRVAYGDHATVYVNGAPTTTYTGTSVSAAVVSSIAAMVWYLRPDLSPAEVMQLIDNSALQPPQAVLADFYSEKKQPIIREVSLCAALKAAWSGRGDNAVGAAISKCEPQVWQPLVIPELPGKHQRIDSKSLTSFQRKDVSTITRWACNPLMWLYSTDDALSSTPSCPTDLFISVLNQRWILPQPGDNPCSNCVLFPTGPPYSPTHALTISAGLPVKQLYKLVISLDPAWIAGLNGASLGNTAMLDIDHFDGGVLVRRRTYAVHVSLPKGGAIVSDFEDGESLKGCRAQLNWIVTKTTKEGTTTMSVQSPVVVDP